ncbi:DHH family phosphoesterase [Shewanella surugensis]|uniref:DHH family phosphoesterase n=1 Tax=Shewanella surugensis TaxID=212020 RepID=A0ABT0LB29_9GAMM|nr:DHH family phosphoesterase [Shewanella surugensis]MCL1124901.1 DHH family phosphoesterase [Shewanella surugensis]
MNYDIFNGDADGIISLLQLRLAYPQQSELITGVKRNIDLLNQMCDVINAHDEVTVLDISMQKNQQGLHTVLNKGAKVFYADHHQSGHIPRHTHLAAHIDLDANICTGLIIDKLLAGRYHTWAIAAAYGDNLITVADGLASVAGLSHEQTQQLKDLGTLINYNGYGACVEDLHFHPKALFEQLLHFPDPFLLFDDKASLYYQLKVAFDADFDKALALKPEYVSESVALYRLPAQAWASRISGVFGNHLANSAPDKAHLVLTEQSVDDVMVSLRAPLNNKQGAVAVCSQFATGGGREAAAGINVLPVDAIEALINVTEKYYFS